MGKYRDFAEQQIAQSSGQRTPQSAQPQIPPLVLTGKRIGPLTYGVSPAFQAEQAVQEQTGKKIAERQLQTQENFRRIIGTFSQLVSQLKGKLEEQGGGGVVKGIEGKVKAALKTPDSGRIGAFPGQRRETALALNNILTGQNRVIKGVLDMIQSTLPNEFERPETAAPKIAQSISNAYKLSRAVEQLGITPQQLQDMSEQELNDLGPRIVTQAQGLFLTDDEQAQLDQLVKQVLAAPPTKPMTFEGEQGVSAPVLSEQGQQVRDRLLKQFGFQ